MKRFKKAKIILCAMVVSLGLGSAALAASNSTLTQVINAGVLSTDILDASRNPVASPSAAMSAKTFNFDCQYGGNASTGTLGSNSQRVYVMNPAAANNGWTLTIAATGGNTARWQNGGATNFMDFNDPTGSNAGCSDGGDADSSAGQLSIDPSVGTVTTDCTTCGLTGVTKGSASAFNQGTTDAITLINAAASSDDVWRGYLTGTGLSQTIPGETPADSYSVNLTLTVTAL